jgi:hypothetical protein
MSQRNNGWRQGVNALAARLAGRIISVAGLNCHRNGLSGRPGIPALRDFIGNGTKRVQNGLQFGHKSVEQIKYGGPDMLRDPEYSAFSLPDDPAPANSAGFCAPGPIDARPSLLLVRAAARSAELAAMADGANFRLIGELPLADAGSSLARIVAADALILDLRGAQAEDSFLDGTVHAVLAWPGMCDAQLLVLTDLAVLDAVVAALGSTVATLLCEAANSDIATALCLIARQRRHVATLHDIGRESDNPRLEQLSEEVRRLAQTIDRLTQGNGGTNAGFAETSRLGDMQPAYAMAPAAFGRVPAQRRAGTGGTISREEVCALLQARRMRDRYLPPDLFADPAWDMMLDLMAARLSGKRVSVSSLCIAAAVPPTTALRWIGQLTERGIFVRTNDPDDARRVFITLSDEAAESLAAWFAATRRAGMRFTS